MRIVSLCPSLTETVFDLGRSADLVGRTRYCVEPAGEVDAWTRDLQQLDSQGRFFYSEPTVIVTSRS